MKAIEKETRNNMRHCGYQVIMKEGQIASVPVKEISRETDAEDKEDYHIRQKSNERAEIVEKEARLSTSKMKIIEPVMKCYCG